MTIVTVATLEQIFRSRDGTPVGVGLLVPGVTPWNSTLAPETGANNPGLRLVLLIKIANFILAPPDF